MMAKLDEIEKVCDIRITTEFFIFSTGALCSDTCPILASQTGYRRPYSRDAHGYAFHRQPYPFAEVARNSQWYTNTHVVPTARVSVVQLF